MNSIRKMWVFALVLCLGLGHRARSQDIIPVLDGVPELRELGGTQAVVVPQLEPSAPSEVLRFLNGPPDIPVEAEQQGLDGVARFINGPTGTSVEVEQRWPHQDTRFINGPTGISVEEEQRIQEHDTRYVNGPTGISIEAEQQRQGQATRIAAQAEAQRPDQDTGGAVINNTGSLTEGQEQTRSSSRGVFSPDPVDELHMNKQLPPGLHIDTTDWSKDPVHWSFKGGDWSLVDLPDPGHPDLPAPVLPGPALVVVTQEVLKKVYVQREVTGLANVTLHYRFFLSQGDVLYGVPELKVYQVLGNTPQLLATEMTRGSWSGRTLHLSQPPPFTIVFEGRLNKEGNEIALDDVTISGFSQEERQGQDDPQYDPQGKALLQDAIPEFNVTTKTTTAGEETTVDSIGNIPTGEIERGGNDTLSIEKGAPTVYPETGPENATDIPKLTDKVLQKTEEAAQITNGTLPLTEGKLSGININVTEIATDISQATSTAREGQKVDESNIDPGVNVSATHDLLQDHNNFTSKDPEETDENPVAESITEASVLFDEHNGRSFLNFTTDNSQDSENNATDSEVVGDETKETSFNASDSDSLNHLKETKQSPTTDSEKSVGINDTSSLHSTTTRELLSERKNKEELLETTSEDITSNTTEALITTVLPPSQPTLQPNLSLNFTTLSPLNITTPSTDPRILEVIPPRTLTTTEGYSFVNTTVPWNSQSTKSTSHSSTMLGDSINPWGTSRKPTTLRPSSSSPSEDISSKSPGMSDEMPVSQTSWGIFQFFLVLCLLGLITLGFLYWRKKRRQDDEIPVFTRSSYTNYHNPTFTPEDDSNFTSRGARSNYKSFE
ncbi:hypothetical protein OTU49_002145 [Cherax quadricarinatus]|uniref:Uncharacterized protein n=1 Tax=Cherax quadricarinatus TaxID=27406 RepID=A0AAW0XQS2_CHEQU